MADISIPGVTNKYGTTELIQQLMEVERVPLTREQKRLDEYKDQQTAWRSINTQMSAVRENVRSLYSFDNPFSSKLSESTDEFAVTANPDRDATVGSFKLDVNSIATTDRFLSDNISKEYEVPAGTYTISVSDKTVSFNWKGGSITDWVAALNRRGGTNLKASLIGVSSEETSLLIESLKTGAENNLVFEDAALDFALATGILTPGKDTEAELVRDYSSLSKTGTLSMNNVSVEDSNITVQSRNGFEIEIPSSVSSASDAYSVSFSISMHENTKQTSSESAATASAPVLPDPSLISYKGIIIFNEQSELGQIEAAPAEVAVEDNSVVYVRTASGERPLEPLGKDGSEKSYVISSEDYPGLKSIIIKNNNTDKTVTLSKPVASVTYGSDSLVPGHAVSTAGDAEIKYEGITMYRSTNEIDDIVPNVTLTLTAPTEKTATISIKPDTDSAKDAIINLVGNYNRLIADINILTSNKSEIITELDYLTDDEIETKEAQLGMFMADSTLTQSKSSLQRILQNSYPIPDSAITMLSQIGVSTSASSGTSGYNQSRLRGYLEIDEKVLDEKLKSNIDDIKKLFGYDSDGDLIVDTGIAYLMENNIKAYTETGGIFSSKISSLDSKITTSQSKIATLEEKLDDKEAQYKRQYGNMEGTLSSLESQSTTIENFSNQQNNKR
ncbi:MAG: flagellar filament capping protein FliD [Treponema sp.]|nr:flagellar filament capping protein FliD [Candidatus Treponema caballi]